MKLKDIIDNKALMKINGCGNDFIVLFDLDEKITPEIVKKLCKLHYGVGSDGLIAVTSSRIKEALFRMKFFNPDDSIT